METITYSQVQELVKKLPEIKLPIAYRLLVNLVANEADLASAQSEFMQLSLSERRRIMSKQAAQIKIHYEQSSDERSEWQSGDFTDEY